MRKDNRKKKEGSLLRTYSNTDKRVEAGNVSRYCLEIVRSAGKFLTRWGIKLLQTTIMNN